MAGTTIPLTSPDLPPSETDAAAVCILELGKALHEAGTPAYTLEETLGQVAAGLGVALQVSALPTQLNAAIGPPERQRLALLRLDPGTINLARLAALNDVARDVTWHRLSPSDAVLRIRAIVAAPLRYSPPLIVLGYAATSAALTPLLAGGLPETAVAAVIGLVTGGLAIATGKSARLAPLFEVLAATMAALVALLATRIVGPYSTITAIAAGVVLLLPGLTLTTAINELATRNLVAGTARLGSVLVTFISLASGVALGGSLAGLVPGVAPSIAPSPLPAWSMVLVVLLASFGFVVTLNARPLDFRWIVPVSAVGVAVSGLTVVLPGVQSAAFLAALLLGLPVNIAARALRRPAAVLLVPGLFMLVPGVVGYQSSLLLLQRDAINGLDLAFSALLTAIFLVAGLLLSDLLVRSTSAKSP